MGDREGPLKLGWDDDYVPGETGEQVCFKGVHTSSSGSGDCGNGEGCDALIRACAFKRRLWIMFMRGRLDGLSCQHLLAIFHIRAYDFPSSEKAGSAGGRSRRSNSAL